jgi:hypothetical protein
MDPVVMKRVLPCNKRQLFDAWSKASVMTTQFPNEEVRGKHVMGWERCLASLERLIEQLESGIN